MNDNDYMKQHECPCCGKIFIPAPEHVYVYENKCYCGWNCFYKTKYKSIPIPQQIEIKTRATAKPVLKCDSNGKPIRTYPSVLAASEDTRICRSGIRLARQGKTLQAGGYLWKYAAIAR